METSTERRPRSALLRQAAVLTGALILVAALIASPLRTYLEQQDLLNAEKAKELALREQLADLEAQRDALSDPDYIRAAARDRLQYVHPGEIPYVIDAPEPVAVPGAGPQETPQDQPWLGALWDTVSEPTS